ncbi:MAG: O-antigen ligase family protein [Nitrospirota bacterium]
MEKINTINLIDNIILLCLMILIVVLPVAHTTTIRSITLFLPLLLLCYKMVLTKSLELKKTPLDIPIILFLLFSVISLFTAVDFEYSLREFRGEALKYFLLFYLIVNIDFDEERIKKIIAVFFGANVIMVIYGIVEFYYHGGILINPPNPIYMAKSLHSGGGTYSTYLITIFPFLFFAYYYMEKGILKLLLLILLLFNIFSIYITHNRGALIAVLVEIAIILVMTILFFKKKKLGYLILIMSIIVVVSLITDKSFFRGEITNMFAKSEDKVHTPLTARLDVWKFTIKKITEDPLKGTGFGRMSFYKKYPQFRKKYGHMWHTHNTFLDIAIQLGVLGLIAFLWLIFRVLKINWRLARDSLGFRPEAQSEGKDRPALNQVQGSLSSRFKTYFGLSTFVMVIGFFMRNMFDDFYVDDSAMLFWFLIGLSVVLYLRRSHETFDSCPGI